MSFHTLADTVEQRPAVALGVFRELDSAINMVVPGNNAYHQRYAGIGEVGLTTIVARDLGVPGSYNPFDRSTPQKLSFTADNSVLHPGAWEPVQGDEKMLGGPVPEWLPGRFSAFALAKIHLLGNSAVWEGFSHLVDTSQVKPGEFGNAGGQRVGGSFLGTSGLWEIHDHAVGLMFYDGVNRASKSDAKPLNADTLSGEIESILGDIQLLHEGTRAEELNREQVASLLRSTDGLILNRLEKRND